MGDPNRMQWIAAHWFELATTALLAVIAINTLDSRWNNATIVEQLNDIIRRFSWLSQAERRIPPRLEFIGRQPAWEDAMSSNESTAGCETVLTATPGESASLDEERGTARAALHSDIECVLPNLRRFARSLTHDAVDADDLVQECLARALGKLQLWKVGTDLRAWLFSILHNEYVSQIRPAARQGTIVDWSQYQPSLTCAPGQIDPLEIRDLVRALTSLPEEQRTAVLMIGLAKGDYYEVASACKVPVGTIRSRRSRGRKTLRALMSVAPLEPHIANRCATTA